jgi:hypothetical protein
MVETSIIVAGIALGGTFLSSLFTAWQTFYSARLKRYEDKEDALLKYKDPLQLATADLASKLLNMVDHAFTTWAQEPASERQVTYALLYTAYLFGQFFSWVHIIRKELQFLRTDPNHEESSRAVSLLLYQIRRTMTYSDPKELFMILEGEQKAMGEIMTVAESNPPSKDSPRESCMGYSTFVDRWNTDPQFQNWFRPIIEDFRALSREECTPVVNQTTPNAKQAFSYMSMADNRLRKMQHLLVDLTDLLDPEGVNLPGVERVQSKPEGCTCTYCRGIKRFFEVPVPRRSSATLKRSSRSQGRTSYSTEKGQVAESRSQSQLQSYA